MTRPVSHPARAPRPAYSLVELVLCLTVLAIVLLGVQSAIRVAGRAIPDGRSGASATAAAAQVLETFAQDVACATALNPARCTAADFEVTVPDRNGDGAPETVRYQFSSTAGTLTRQVNGGTAVTVAANVSEFTLALDKKAVANPQTTTESPEVVLCSHDPAVTLTAQRINKDNYRGQYFVPTLPANATAWRVTRVMLQVAAWGASNGQTQVQLRTAPGGLPASAVVDEATLTEGTLTSAYRWTTFCYTRAGGLRAGDGMCIVLLWVSDADSCGVNYLPATGVLANANLVKSADGVTWSAVTTDDLAFYVYGTYGTPDPITYSYTLADVRCALRLGPDPNARCETGVRTLNQPQVTGP